jgi:hypothetical protein
MSLHLLGYLLFKCARNVCRGGDSYEGLESLSLEEKSSFFLRG